MRGQFPSEACLLNQDTIGVAEALRRLGGIRSDTLHKLVERGSLSCVREPNAYGQACRRFRPEDIEGYKARRLAALRERVARLESTHAEGAA